MKIKANKIFNLVNNLIAVGLLCFSCQRKQVAIHTFNYHHDQALSKEEVKSFFKQGWVTTRLFAESEIAAIRPLFEEAHKEAKDIVRSYYQDHVVETKTTRFDYPSGSDTTAASISAYCHNSNQLNPFSIQLISWVGGVKERLLQLGRHPNITIPVAQLLDSSTADHLINQVHYKNPYDQVTFPWHQDVQNRRAFDPEWKDVNERGSFVQVVLAIDPMQEDNGPLIYIPNSHKLDLGLDKTSSAEEEKIAAQYDLRQTKYFHLNPGEVVFMHPLLVHKSDENRSNKGKSRILFINGYAYPGANHKKYPGTGSAQCIDLPISPDLLEETKEFVSTIQPL